MRYFNVRAAGVAIFSAIELSCPTPRAEPAGHPFNSRSNRTIDVEVETRGRLPGYTDQELRAYVGRRMTALATAPWHFEQASLLTPAILQTQVPNRVIWIFRRSTDAVGTIRYIGPGSSGTIVSPGINRKVAIKVLLIRDHVPLGSIVGEASSNGFGSNEMDLDPVISQVLKRLACDDATATINCD